METQQDLYAILGVLPNAESVVITAAYRALSSRYHPDRWEGPKDVAHEMMVEINKAYEVLRDPGRRHGYDQTRSNEKPSFDEASEETTNAFDEAMTDMEERWEVAMSIFPELGPIRAALAKTSHQLAFAFVAQLLVTRKFSHSKQIATAMERSFLERYFGTDERILTFANELIALGMRDAVKALNRLIGVLGSEVESERLINKICKDYHVNHRRGEVAASGESESKRRAIDYRIRELNELLITEPFVSHAEELARLLGFTVETRGGSFFRDGTYVVAINGNKVVALPSGPEFVRWAQKSLLR